MVRRVLIAGCGYVGTALGRLLAEEGAEVWGLRRSPDVLPSSLRPLEADLSDPPTLESLPSGLDAVVHAASADERTPEGYRRTYVDGVRNLLEALPGGRKDAPRFVLVSSTGVYGDRDGGWVNEGTPPDPDRWSGEILLEGEEVVRSAPVRGIVLRLGGIYGPGRTRLVDRVRSGEARCFEGDPVFTNRIHRDDCAGALRHLLHLEAPGPLYLGVDREPAERCEVLRWLARRLGVPDPPVVEAPGGRGRGSKRCFSDALVRSGYTFRHPTYRDGYAAILEGDSSGEGLSGP